MLSREIIEKSRCENSTKRDPGGIHFFVMYAALFMLFSVLQSRYKSAIILLLYIRDIQSF